ncbi:MAG TPA: hypothetical protein VM471_09520 [Phenylobacterium sp.]|jgi:hypothetical protein|nr:hypothetical protein [Phenylobacterium sp.]
MPRYTREGRTHKILRRLSVSPTGMGLLARELGHEYMSHPEYKKLWRLLDHLLDEGLIESSKPLFFISQDGLQRLAGLDREPAPLTSVRIFERRAA